MLQITEACKTAYPGARAGLLLMRSVINRGHYPALENARKNLPDELQERYGHYQRPELKKMAPLWQYVDYYKRFKKTYPVLLQLESVIFKGRTIPHISPLVEAMFMAELKNLLLTAGYDYALIKEPLTLGVSEGGEPYTLLGGREKELPAGE